MLRPTYPVRTERLVLRPFTADDLADLRALTGDPEVVRYLYWEVHDEEQTREGLRRRMGQSELAEEGQWLVLAMDLDGKVIGQVVLKWTSMEHRQGELGFVLHPAYQGKGYAREASEAVLRLGFEDLGLHRITGACDTRNVPSWQLMSRLGMRREAHFVEDEWFKGAFGDQYIYAMLDREWRARYRSST
ncbi:GNAT family N-acetyltransferase [Dactylosporangium roseum]|uniref:GNAT family N-acetyltransferase n=1 Tax=Dactylosporangium roseum TaxID=47989 RepID=A0ABY5Z313_9ACTN|nr:GNAT family N-acetyltransferase [Dactylosporangium roseum]UWZ34859.1 GNAT family N-acetyltransferase [Dactylosporangium roseum]